MNPDVTTTESATPTILSIEQLNRQIRQLVEGSLELVWVQGEISNFKAHSSGHFYFSLKDAKSQIRAVMFRGHNSRLKFKPNDGLEVIVRGRVTVYEPRGDYQITCETMEPVGAGALQKAFEQLKAKLQSEGLFSAQRKRKIPTMPKHVAIVTSPTGAAIQDMINVLSRRNKTVEVTLIPTVVQGESAAPQIIEALKTAYRLHGVDVIILARGGGSVEDMWCFNDEQLARTITQSPVPVISAVGHEIDFTIADFVADLRAPTPSAAAELVVKSTEEIMQKLAMFDRMLVLSIEKFFKFEMQKIRQLAARLQDPKRKLQDLILRSDDLLSRLQNASVKFFEKKQMQINLLQGKLSTPEKILQKLRSSVQLAANEMSNQIRLVLQNQIHRQKRAMSLLDGLSPLRVVERGYSITTKKNKIIKNMNELNENDSIQILLAHGEIDARVVALHKKELSWNLKKN